MKYIIQASQIVSQVPEWAQFTVLNLLSLLVILRLVSAIEKIVSEPRFKKRLTSLKKMFMNFLKQFFHSPGLSDPNPKLERFSVFVKIFTCYGFALVIFSWSVVFMGIAATGNLHTFKPMQAALVGFFYLLASRWFYDLGEKERNSLK